MLKNDDDYADGLVDASSVVIDTTFDFQSDTPKGFDPDKYSPTLHRYQQFLWSKPLPDGRPFELVDDRPVNYLVHDAGARLFWLSSDAVVPSFPHKAAAIVSQLGEGEHQTFWNLGYTIGGMMLWPSYKVDNRQTINGARGFHPRIADRFDLTVECVRRHHAGEHSPLAEVMDRYADYFALFGSFEGFIDHFLLHDILEHGEVRFALPFDDFASPPVPRSLDDYRRYVEISSDFIRARNERIAAYVRASDRA